MLGQCLERSCNSSLSRGIREPARRGPSAAFPAFLTSVLSLLWSSKSLKSSVLGQNQPGLQDQTYLESGTSSEIYKPCDLGKGT